MVKRKTNNDGTRRLQRALSVNDVYALEKPTYCLSGKWHEAFGEIDRTGVWFIWGKSGSGKTTFVLELCKELAKYGRVAYDSLEEGDSLTMKASFANPNNLLIPGMYATIVSDAELAQGSILVPTKALIQLLNKDMLDVVVDGKVQQKAVKVGATYGLYTIIESGIDVTDEVIVEGQNKVQIGQAVEAVETTREEMEESATKAAADQHGLAK